MNIFCVLIFIFPTIELECTRSPDPWKVRNNTEISEPQSGVPVQRRNRQIR